jgi:hypothetical protein
VMVSIFLMCGKHLQDRMISLRREASAHRISSTQSNEPIGKSGTAKNFIVKNVIILNIIHIYLIFVKQKLTCGV